jgi:hypothetical protein
LPASWTVFRSDPAGKANFIEDLKNCAAIELTRVRLVAFGNACNLDMAYMRRERFEPCNDVAFDDLHMIDVEQQTHIRQADGLNDVTCLVCSGHEISTAVATIERLYHHRHILLGGARSGIFQMTDKRLARGRALRCDGARHHIDIAGADLDGIGQGLIETGIGFRLVSRHGGKAQIIRPAPARR